MITELTFSPDILDENCYSDRLLCRQSIYNLKELALNDSLISSLKNGAFLKYIDGDKNRWHQIFKNLLPDLIKNNRFINRPTSLSYDSSTDEDWIKEAIDLKVKGSILSKNIFISHKNSSYKKHLTEVYCIENIFNSEYWKNRSCSVRLKRDIDEYVSVLKLVLMNSNSLIFIDPYLDPSPNLSHKNFYKLLTECENMTLKNSVQVNIHIKKNKIEIQEWKKTFKNHLFSMHDFKKLKFDIYIWDDFHDRYLISDLIGISVPNGFDTTTDEKNITTWTRLALKDKEEVEREFDPNAKIHNFLVKFSSDDIL